jgi:hypothetical protein
MSLADVPKQGTNIKAPNNSNNDRRPGKQLQTENQRPGGAVAAVVANQDDDGGCGPKKHKESRDIWPNMVMLHALRSRYEATGADPIVPMMTRYFRYRLSSPPGALYPNRWRSPSSPFTKYQVIPAPE